MKGAISMAQAKILVVEDEGIVAQEIKSRLQRLGYTVCGIVHSGSKAIEKTDELTPDLVLMDIKLKGDIDGIEAAAEIKKRCNIPVIYLTAYTDEETLKRAKTMEPFGYIVKPFEERNLMVSIEIALHRHKSEKERLYREKLQAVLETAGAVCHELHQPMMAISGHAELLMLTVGEDEPLYEKIVKIKHQIDRMGQITHKLMGITKYETKNYSRGDKIVDLDKSTTHLG